jgi:hypothetical protein
VPTSLDALDGRAAFVARRRGEGDQFCPAHGAFAIRARKSICARSSAEIRLDLRKIVRVDTYTAHWTFGQGARARIKASAAP